MVAQNNLKGDIGLTKAMADLAEKEFLVSVPTSEHAPFDLVAYHYSTQKFYRIQVKYISVDEKELVRLRFRDRNKILIDVDQCDIICVYNPQTNRCYYLSKPIIDEFSSRQNINFRIHESIRANSKDELWLGSYEQFPHILDNYTVDYEDASE